MRHLADIQNCVYKLDDKQQQLLCSIIGDVGPSFGKGDSMGMHARQPNPYNFRAKVTTKFNIYFDVAKIVLAFV